MITTKKHKLQNRNDQPGRTGMFGLRDWRRTRHKGIREAGTNIDRDALL
jgi:hypothetical protein